MEPQAPRPLGPRYASIFALVFCALLVAPLFKSGISVAYLSQDFLGREQLIEAFNTVRLQLGDRVFPQVLVGKEGWMYLYSVSEIGDYQHSNQFATKHEMAYYQMQLDMINARLKKQGIKFLVVIPPDKASIYPQYVPDEIKVFPGPSRLDQFIHFMHQRGKTQILDLRPALKEASKSQQVYYKTDANYTYIAWYIAYEQILSTLSQWYPELKPRPLSDFRVVSGKPRTMQLPELMG